MNGARAWAVLALAAAFWAVPAPADGDGPRVEFSGRVLAVIDADLGELAPGKFARDYVYRTQGQAAAFKASRRPPGSVPDSVIVFVDGAGASRHADAVGVWCPRRWEEFCWTLREGQRLRVEAEVVAYGELAFGSSLRGRRFRVVK